MSYPGAMKKGHVVDEPLVSNGLDLLPTMCDYAGIQVPKDLQGKSLRALAEGDTPREWRDHLVMEIARGRCVHTGRYKYTFRTNGRHELFDLAADPHENENRVADPASRQIVGDMHGRLRDVMRETDDPMLATVPDQLPA